MGDFFAKRLVALITEGCDDEGTERRVGEINEKVRERERGRGGERERERLQR
jgi:hypothetical protein